MSHFKRNALNHFKYLTASLQPIGARAALDLHSFLVTVHVGQDKLLLFPQFRRRDRSGRLEYTPRFGPNVDQFIGWLPYYNKRWDLATDKLAFKAYACARGGPTPEYSQDPGAALTDVLVKPSRSTFGVGIRGPFRSSRDTVLDADRSEFFERYVPGEIAKVWFWNGSPTCLELQKPPAVVGDGVRTLRNLIEDRLSKAAVKTDPLQTEPFLDYCGVSLESVPPRGQAVQVDYKYGSPLKVRQDTQDSDLATRRMPDIDEQLSRIGRMLFEGIPGEIRQNTLFTVDAIVDSAKRVWILEMNCNPFVHPFAYRAMLANLQSNRELLNNAESPEFASSAAARVYGVRAY